MNDMITIFNQLTHNELADCNRFENIIVNHFRKYKLIYNTYMRYLDLEKVNKITCKDNKKGLSIKINYKKGCLDSNIFKGVESDVFVVEVYCEDNTLTINVSDKDKGEVELYEDRFNRRKKIYFSQ
ncbi:hypothetical protein [Romboutsia ilealis]|uniref:hypothetical protein n=1 Tax=Romboutsia ilealis TaxID=1115758 RepID=UPI00272D3FA8|nr:hypothetical protein [Romboutsia ilealis]